MHEFVSDSFNFTSADSERKKKKKKKPSLSYQRKAQRVNHKNKKLLPTVI